MADNSRTLSVAGAVGARAVAVLALVAPRLFYGFGMRGESIGFICSPIWEPSNAEATARDVVWWAQLLLPALAVAAIVAELYGRRRVLRWAAGTVGLTAVASALDAVVIPRRHPCTGAVEAIQFPWVQLASYAVAVVLLLWAARTPLSGRRPGRVEMLAWAGVAALTLLACLPFYGFDPYDWTCDPDVTAQPDLFWTIDERLNYIRRYAVPGGYAAVLAAAAIPLGRGAVLGSLPLFAVGFAYAAMEFAAPTCGGSRFTAGLNAVEWAMVGAALLVVLAGVLAARSRRPALEESPAVRRQAPPWLMIVAAAVVLCGFVWLVFSYFGLG